MCEEDLIHELASAAHAGLVKMLLGCCCIVRADRNRVSAISPVGAAQHATGDRTPPAWRSLSSPCLFSDCMVWPMQEETSLRVGPGGPADTSPPGGSPTNPIWRLSRRVRWRYQARSPGPTGLLTIRVRVVAPGIVDAGLSRRQRERTRCTQADRDGTHRIPMAPPESRLAQGSNYQRPISGYLSGDRLPQAFRKR